MLHRLTRDLFALFVQRTTYQLTQASRGSLSVSWACCSTAQRHAGAVYVTDPPEPDLWQFILLGKRHFDRFISFCRAHERDQQTHRQCYSVCNNRHWVYAMTCSVSMVTPVALSSNGTQFTYFPNHCSTSVYCERNWFSLVTLWIVLHCCLGHLVAWRSGSVVGLDQRS